MKQALLVAAAMLAFGSPVAGLAVSQAADDHLIVRNERAGRLRLGMTAAEVVSLFGQPQRSGFLGSGEGYLNYYDTAGHQTISAMTWGPRNEVFQINIDSAAQGYATVEGITIGMSELNVRLRLGQPNQRIWEEVPSYWALYYPGLVLYINPTTGVGNIALCQTRYQHRGRAGRRWCY